MDLIGVLSRCQTYFTYRAPASILMEWEGGISNKSKAIGGPGYQTTDSSFPKNLLIRY